VRAEASDKATIRVNCDIDSFTAYEIACELLDSTDLTVTGIESDDDNTIFSVSGCFCTTGLF
ncbi:MAG: hypothetical protein RLY43_1251, partial [Bacteroidota bacterium]